jgi:ceramide glucosyltransferase
VGQWDAVTVSGAALWLMVLGWAISTMFAALAQPRKRLWVCWPRSRPSISVIVPVSSTASSLPKCAASLAELDYPEVEVLLCAAEDDRSATEAVAAAHRIEPTMRTCVVTRAALINPKSALLAAVIPKAKHGLLLLTDDNVVSSPLRIQTHLAYWEAGYGLVSASVLGNAAENFWGELSTPHS